CLWTKHRFQLLQHLAAIHAQKHGALAGAVRHAQFDPHQKSVELRFGQRKSADLVLRILSCDHKKRLGQLIRHAIDRDLVLLHRFKQRALRFGSGAVYLIDQHDLRKERPAMKHEALLASIEDGIAENIGRQQVACKLDALKGERERARQRLRKRCLAHARNIFNQEMAACEQTGDCELYRLIFPYYNFANLLREGVNVIRHSDMICGNDAIRKQGYAENDSINLVGIKG